MSEINNMRKSHSGPTNAQVRMGNDVPHSVGESGLRSQLSRSPMPEESFDGRLGLSRQTSYADVVRQQVDIAEVKQIVHEGEFEQDTMNCFTYLNEILGSSGNEGILVFGECPVIEYKNDFHTCNGDINSGVCEMRLNKCVQHHFDNQPRVVIFPHTGYRIGGAQLVELINQTTSNSVYMIRVNLSSPHVLCERDLTGGLFVTLHNGVSFSCANQPFITNGYQRFGPYILNCEIVYQSGDCSVVELSCEATKDVSARMDVEETKPIIESSINKLVHGQNNMAGKKNARKKKALTSSKTIKTFAKCKQTRNDKKNALVAKSLKDEEEKQTAEVDVFEEKSEEDMVAELAAWKAKFGTPLDGADGKEIKIEAKIETKVENFVVNPWVLFAGTTSRKYQFKIDDTEILICGPTEIGGVKRQMAGRFPIWNGHGILTNTSSDGVFGNSPNVGNARWASDATLMRVMLNDVEARLKVIMTTHIFRWFNGKHQMDVNVFRNCVRAAYRRFYVDEPGLDHRLTELINSAWWAGLILEHSNQTRRHWEVHGEAHLLQLGALRGHDAWRVKTMLKRRENNMWWWFWANPITYFKLLFWIIFYGEFYARIPNFQIQALNLVYDNYMPATIPNLIPCAYLGRKRTRFPVDRELPPCGPDYKIEFKEDLPEYSIEQEPIEIYGMTLETEVCIPNSGAESVNAAVRIRMSPERQVDENTCNWFVDYSKKIIDSLPILELKQATDAQLETFLIGKYGPKKAMKYIPFIGLEPEPKDLDCEMFCKGEAYIGKNPDNFKPRMIFSYSYWYTANFSFYFDQINEYFKKMLGKETNCFYTSGADPDTVGEWVADEFRSCGSAVEMDASNFDGSVLTHQMLVELYWIERLIRGLPDAYQHIITSAFRRRCYTADRCLELIKESGRETGALQTGFGNTFIAVLEFCFCYQYTLFDDNWSGVFNGDDNLTFHYGNPDHELALRMYTALGRDMKQVIRDNLNDCEYCSGYFWMVEGSCRYGSKPFKVLSKLGMNFPKASKKHFKGRLYGTVKGLMCVAGHVPIVGAILRGLANTAEARGIRPIHDSSQWNPYRIQGGICCRPSLDTYYQFSEMYKVEVDVVMAVDCWLEETIDIQDCPYFLSGELINMLAAMENGCDGFDFDNLLMTPSKKFICEIAPVYEEIQKLIGVSSMYEALSAGADFGTEEDTEYGTNTHWFWHSLFSGLSYLNLNWGIGAHKLYNVMAYESGAALPELVPCAKKKKKNGKFGQAIQRFRKSKIPRNLMNQAAGDIGGYFGGPMGSELGKMLSNQAANVMGMGDYHFNGAKKNSLVISGVPKFRRSTNADRNIRFTHTEYLGEVSGSVGFSLTSFPINIGLPTTFPWGSDLAANFQQYRILGCLFVFVSNSGDSLSSTNTALGSVIMCTNYDIEAANYGSKSEMENSMGVTSGKPSANVIHGVECSTTDRPYGTLAIRHGDLAADDDGRLFDMGNFQLATVGMQAAAVIGEIWVSYEAELLKPKASTNPLQGLYFRYANTTYSNGSPFGATLGTEYGTMPGVSVTTTAIVLSPLITAGVYYLCVHWGGASTAVTLANPTLVNCTSIDYAGIVADRRINTGVTALYGVYMTHIQVSGYAAGGTSLTFSGNTLPTTPVVVAVTLVAVPTSSSEV